MKHSHVYATQAGPVLIEEVDGSISLVAFGAGAGACADSPSALTNACATQLMEYLAGKRKTFDVPLLLDGTDFQTGVWEACLGIPYGCTWTCSEVAEAMGQPSARRQAGRAAGVCKLAPLVPVHRISSMDDRLSVALRRIEARAIS
ncbi:MAG: methylated-DNA--[protein]-cysteine S-methyltransferase [Eggerthellaceae bacterium]|nr:methylated-DNA--[protein]-cysteine S-methyltransferase [Eggerthellaceae bacterium]